MWQALDSSEDIPGPRAAHSCDLIDNKLYVFGGWNGKKALNDLHILDIASMAWSEVMVVGVPPATRNNHTLSQVGTKLYIHGGHDGSKWLADMHILTLVSALNRAEWSQPMLSGEPPSARACHTTTRLGRKLYMFGGYDGTKCFNDVDVLDLETMTWIQPRVSGRLPQARNAHTMTVVGQRLVLFGGHSGNKHLRDLHILHTDTLTWAEPDLTGSLPPGLRGHTANLVGDRLFLFGGYDGRGRSNDLYVLNMETMHWSHPPTTDATPAGRQRHTACLVGSKKLFIFGGFDGFRWLNDLYMLDVGKLEECAITTRATTLLIGNMRRLIDNPDLFPDVTFLVEGRPIYAHKAILAVQCDQFSAMFCGAMRESQEDQIEIPATAGWSHQAFLTMLEFLYTGSVQNFNAETAIDLLGLADHYTLGALKRLCENTLIHNVDTENVSMLFSCAHRCVFLRGGTGTEERQEEQAMNQRERE